MNGEALLLQEHCDDLLEEGMIVEYIEGECVTSLGIWFVSSEEGVEGALEAEFVVENSGEDLADLLIEKPVGLHLYCL